MNDKLIFVGLYKQKEVFIIEHKKPESWSIILRHKRFGDLRVDNLDYEPKVGMAKRYFREWLRNLNEKELEENDGKRVYNDEPEQKNIRVTPEEIEGWLNE